MFRLNSYLFSLAANFCGRYTPYQGITLTPHSGGVAVTSSDRGAASFYGFDPQGYAPEEATFSPGDKLASACNGIKTAARELTIEDTVARVTTYYKDHSNSAEFVATRLQHAAPLRHAIAGVIGLWRETPELSTTAGRYDIDLLTKACRSIAKEGDSVVISGYDGGPLRLQSERLNCVVLLMPQTAQPLPPLPPWLADFGQEGASVKTA
jgi:hypothetical protein